MKNCFHIVGPPQVDRQLFLLIASIALLVVLAPAAPAPADLLAGMAFEGGVLRFDDDTAALLPGDIPNFTAGLISPSGVTVGPDGNIYVSSRGTGEVLFFDGVTGAPLPSPQSGGRDGLFAMLPDNPPGEPGGDPVQAGPGPLRFGPDGHLYVSDFGGGTTVRKFHGTSGALLTDAASGLVDPAGLSFASNGDLYVGEFDFDFEGGIYRVHNGIQELFVPPGTGGLQTPSSILFLKTGEFLVVDLLGNQILKYAANGDFVEQFAEIPPEIPNPPPPGLAPSNNPSDIAYDADGNLVVAVLGLTYPPDNRGAILRYDLEGNLIETLIDMQSQLGSIAWIADPNAVPGDYNGNGSVGPEDYDKWKNDYGKWVAKGGGADGNGDGKVGPGDYTFWRNALAGSAPAAGSGATEVPEPTTLLLLVVAGFWVALSRSILRATLPAY